jgi:hypothetical protein
LRIKIIDLVLARPENVAKNTDFIGWARKYSRHPKTFSWKPIYSYCMAISAPLRKPTNQKSRFFYLLAAEPFVSAGD